MKTKMPRPSLTPTVAPRTIDALVHEFREFDAETAQAQYPWADRFVMGLPLAPWQREFKWTEQQSQRFITSAWTGVFLGTYVLTVMELRANDASFKGIEYLPLSNCVIEGQQRLRTLELYLTNKLAVPDADGKLAMWDDVDLVEQRRFRNVIFSRGELRERDEAKLRLLYNLMNFGGVAHDEAERA
jgi:hypothetical protein